MKSKGHKGFTLIELATAMAVAAIAAGLALTFHRDFGRALREAWRRLEGGQAETAWVGALRRGMLEGRGMLEVSDRTLAFVARGGQAMRLERTAVDSVRWNGKAMPFPAAGLEIGAEGPACPADAPDPDPDCLGLDSLDGDGNGSVDLDELDRDRDGIVSGRECRHLRLVRLRWRSAPGGPWRTLALHPRKKVAEAPEGGDFR